MELAAQPGAEVERRGCGAGGACGRQSRLGGVGGGGGGGMALLEPGAATAALAAAASSGWRRRRARRGKWRRRRGPARRRAAAELAPYNSNQFLMEEHMPEPRHSRTRDSSFSVDEEDPYFFPIPEDEEDFISKEFSSVYEDAQSERLAGMTKDDLVQEYLLLQARCEALTKRLVSRPDPEPVPGDVSLRLREQDEIIRQLRSDNQSLKSQLERPPSSTSNEDSESDSSSTSCSDSTLSPAMDVSPPSPPFVNGAAVNGNGAEHTYDPAGVDD